MKLKPYSEYNDSGVEWIRNIPSNWDLVRNKNIFSKSKNIVGDKWEDYPVLSLTKKGVIIRDIESNEGKMPSDFSIYQIVRPSNLLLCLFDIDVTPRCIGYINNKGIVSAAYSEIAPTTDIYTKYYYYWYLMLDFDKQLLHLSKNLRNSLSNEDFMALPIVKPSINEQKQISSFLDEKISKVDLTIEKDTRLIELLKEKRTALINHVVTKGLDPKVKMKDSGVEWIGEIPEDWEIKKLKYVSDLIPGQSPHESTYNADGNGSILINGPNEYSESDFGYTRSLKWTTAPKKWAPSNSLLFCMRGSTTGRLNIAHTNISIGRGVAAIVAKNDQDYLNYIMIALRSYVIGNSRGSTFPSVTTDDLGNYFVPEPPSTEQTKISGYLNKSISKIDKTIQKIQENIDLIEEYKKSLIHHVVTGKVNVIKED
nr:restriction endonuclease subunit S [uncultured Methanobacterium sp.]